MTVWTSVFLKDNHTVGKKWSQMVKMLNYIIVIWIESEYNILVFEKNESSFRSVQTPIWKPAVRCDGSLWQMGHSNNVASLTLGPIYASIHKSFESAHCCNFSNYCLVGILSDFMLVWGRVSNGTGQFNFSRSKGQKFIHCPGTKGQRDKLKILPREGTGRDSQNPGRDAGQNGKEQKRTF